MDVKIGGRELLLRADASLIYGGMVTALCKPPAKQFTNGLSRCTCQLKTIFYLLPLRIDYHNEGKYYTNLYEIDGKVSVWSANDTVATVVCEGELKSRDFETCGVKYSLTYEFFADELIKRIKLRCDPDQLRKITVVEPIVKNAETEFIQKSSHIVTIKTNNGAWEFKVLNGNGELLLGIDEEKYWCPFPSLECYPISIKLSESAEITYGLKRIISEQK